VATPRHPQRDAEKEHDFARVGSPTRRFVDGWRAIEAPRPPRRPGESHGGHGRETTTSSLRHRQPLPIKALGKGLRIFWFGEAEHYELAVIAGAGSN
jgi:hypothetical protein